MLQERLLERIRRIENNPDDRSSSDPNQVINSILVHLRKILNTRQGSVQIDEFYGIPDFTDLAATFSSESVRDLARSIKQVVTRYEPRLTSVNIEASQIEEQVFELRFKIDGKLAMGNNIEMPVTFETVVDPDGRIKVQQ